MKTTRMAAFAVAAMVALSACKKDNAQSVSDTLASMAGTEATAMSTALEVRDIELGRSIGADNKIADGTSDFKASDTIIAVVETHGAANGASLVARWTYEDGQLVEEQTQTVTSTEGTAYTHFRISKPSGWPVGSYKVTVSLNNAEVGSEDFKVSN